MYPFLKLSMSATDTLFLLANIVILMEKIFLYTCCTSMEILDTDNQFGEITWQNQFGEITWQYSCNT